MGSFSIWHWAIVLAIVLVVFGTKKLRGAGSDIGAGIKDFQNALKSAAPKSEPERREHGSEDRSA